MSLWTTLLNSGRRLFDTGPEPDLDSAGADGCAPDPNDVGFTAAVVGLGGALYATQRQAAPPEPVVSVGVAPPVEAPAPAAAKSVVEKTAAVPAVEKPHKPRPVPVKKAAPIETPAVSASPVVVAPAPMPVPVCADCATVTAVTPVEREAEASGTGAIAGGLLGGLVGNQVGNGSGRALATAIGVFGGGIAGNEVEKKMKRVVVYQIELRMDDGSRRTLQLDAPVAVGARVRLDGGGLQAVHN